MQKDNKQAETESGCSKVKLGIKSSIYWCPWIAGFRQTPAAKEFHPSIKIFTFILFSFWAFERRTVYKNTLIPKQSNKNFVKPLELKITVCTWVTHSLFVHKQWMWIVNLRQNYVFIQDTAYRNNYYFSLGTVFMVFIQVFFPTATLIAHKYYLFSPCNNFVKL